MSTQTGIGYRYRFDNVELDERLRELRVDGRLVEIEPKPMAVLLSLLRRPGEVMTREELLMQHWEGRVTVHNVLANAVSKVRDILGDLASKRIVTVPKVGYMFSGSLIREAMGRPNLDAAPLSLRAGDPVPGRESSYRLLEPLGQATRHAVWRAQHVSLRETRVFKFALNGDQLAALKRELTLTRYLVATLGPRDDLCLVTDTNFRDSPFFVEYPDFGTDLLHWAHQSSAWSAKTLKQRLDIFLTIAKTVTDAHAVGVLHKDIKPSNILIRDGVEGLEVRLADFGSGRLAEGTEHLNESLAVMGMTVTDVHNSTSPEGTWAYMAPEVLKGQTYTAAADVYSLGILLYQFICGDFGRFLTSDWRDAVRDPELESDVEGATSSNPHDRQLTAQQLMVRVQDLQSRRERRVREEAKEQQWHIAQRKAEKVIARRPWLIATIGLLVLAASATSLLSYQLKQALGQSQLAQRQSEALSAFVFKDVFRSADLTRAEAGAVPAAGLTAVLGAASKQAAERFAAEPGIEAMVRALLGEAFARANHPNATREFKRAIALYDQYPDLNPSMAIQTKLIFAKMLADDGKVMEARQLLDGQVPLLSALGEEASPLLWARKYHVDVALAHAVLDGQAELKAARAYAAQLAKVPDVALPEQHAGLTILADALGRAGEATEAAAVFRKATEAPFTPASVGAHSWSFTKGREALLAIQLGQLNQAQAMLDAAVEVHRRLPDPVPSLTWDLKVAQAYIDELSGRLQQAAKSYKEAGQLAVIAFGEESPLTASTMSNAAVMASYLEEPRHALRLIDSEIARAQAIYRSDNPNEAGPVMELLRFHRALVLTRSGRPKEALEILERLSGSTLSKQDVAPGWEARLGAERARARLGLATTAHLRAELAAQVESMRQQGAPAWVVEHYLSAL